jgi:DNA-directed RNA polymerase subunit M/transcription elongation factor TFIIS
MEKFSNNNDKIREKYVVHFNKVIDNEKLSRQIEQSIYNYIISFSREKNIQRNWGNTVFYKLYVSKIMSVYLNLNKNSYIHNEHFLKKIKNKEIKPEDIGNLSVYDIYPENWKDLMNLKSKRDKIRYELKPEAMTSLFKCRKCKSRETSYYEVQTRSADEPMTQFITCLSCSNRWRQ